MIFMIISIASLLHLLSNKSWKTYFIDLHFIFAHYEREIIRSNVLKTDLKAVLTAIE